MSCANRQYELIKGRNARGMVPTKLAPLAPRQVYYMANGRTVLKRMEHTTHSAELIVAAMRDSVHAVAFAWRGPADRAALLRTLTENIEQGHEAVRRDEL